MVNGSDDAMKLLERLKKEWPGFVVLARSAGRLCARKVRKEDSTQEMLQIRTLLPKTRYLQVATCLSVLFLFYLIRFGCSPSDKPTQFATIGCGRAEQGTMHKKSNSGRTGLIGLIRISAQQIRVTQDTTFGGATQSDICV